MCFPLQRIFVFFVKDLSYEKKDLNEPSSQNRLLVGVLSRAITNSIFLSHALRENIIIRIFVQEEVPHVYHISSDNIRYLGPEERSFASICRKAERFLKEKISQGIDNEIWYQPNPGFFLKVADNPFVDLDDKLANPAVIYEITVRKPAISLIAFEELLLTQTTNQSSLIFPFVITTKEKQLEVDLKEIIPFDHQYFSIALEQKYDIPKLVSIIHLILDKKE